jgi:hypothetical protein
MRTLNWAGRARAYLQPAGYMWEEKKKRKKSGKKKGPPVQWP